MKQSWGSGDNCSSQGSREDEMYIGRRLAQCLVHSKHSLSSTFHSGGGRAPGSKEPQCWAGRSAQNPSAGFCLDNWAYRKVVLMELLLLSGSLTGNGDLPAAAQCRGLLAARPLSECLQATSVCLVLHEALGIQGKLDALRVPKTPPGKTAPPLRRGRWRKKFSRGRGGHGP